jgi:hypothetical protein
MPSPYASGSGELFDKLAEGLTDSPSLGLGKGGPRLEDCIGRSREK